MSLLVLCTLPLTGNTQERKVQKVLTDVYNHILTNEPTRSNDDALFKPGNEMLVLSAMEQWLTDTLSDVRHQAVSYIGIIGLRSTEAAIKQQSTQLLVQAGTSGEQTLSSSAVRYLARFNRRDFTKSTCDTIRSTVRRAPTASTSLIRLVGFLDLRDMLPFLDSVYRYGNTSNSFKWAIKLAQARLGDSSSAEYCLNLAKSVPVNDNLVFNVLPDLVYTRNKIIYSYLLDILYSDDENCSSPNPYFSARISCAYGVMEALAPVVVNFPLTTDSNGELITSSYEKALKETREWFNQHGSSYELRTDTY